MAEMNLTGSRLEAMYAMEAAISGLDKVVDDAPATQVERAALELQYAAVTAAAAQAHSLDDIATILDELLAHYRAVSP